jgi:hypothetical protein
MQVDVLRTISCFYSSIYTVADAVSLGLAQPHTPGTAALPQCSSTASPHSSDIRAQIRRSLRVAWIHFHHSHLPAGQAFYTVVAAGPGILLTAVWFAIMSV